MTDQTISADELRALLDGEGSAADKIQAIYDDLLPAPLPDPLFGSRATHPEYGEGIVTSHYPDRDGEVRFMVRNSGSIDGTGTFWVEPSTLTFHTPDHPVLLETEEDYANAPTGTVVAENELWPCILTRAGWEYAHKNRIEHSGMAGVRRRVIRWGWEA